MRVVSYTLFKDSYIQFGFRLDSGYYKKLVGIKVKPREWNKKAQRAIGSTEAAADCNRKLALWEGRMNDLYYDSLRNGVKITDKDIETRVFFKKNERAISFIDFIEKEIEKRKQDVLFKQTTIKKYNSLVVALKAYENIYNTVLHFNDIDHSFFDTFRGYLQSVRRINGATQSKYLSKIRTFVRQAAKLKYVVPPDYKDLKIKDYKAYHIYLTIDELFLMYQCDYKSDRLRNAVNLFMIEAFTGLRFGDGAKLQQENIISVNGRDMIYIQEGKTEAEPLYIPVHYIVSEILKSKMPHKISNQKLNVYVREAAQMAGITKSVVHYYDKAGENKSQVIEKYKLITSHTARRSLITNMLKQGIPSTLIRKISGHKSESSFRRYICFDNEEAAVLLADYPFFKAG